MMAISANSAPHASSVPLLELIELAATRPGGDLLGPVSLQIKLASCVALVGPTGAGREDLIDIVTGQSRPRSGRIYFDGHDLQAPNPAFRIRAGMARCRCDQPPPHTESLRTWLTMARTIMQYSPLKLWLHSLHHLDRATHSDLLGVLEFTGLRDAIDEPPARLSPAQCRLAHLAASLLQKPKLLIVERPFSGLDAQAREIWAKRLLQLNEDGVALLIMDDCPHWLAQFCDQMVVMTQGRVIANGTPDEVGNDPAAVEAFTGSPQLP